MEEVKYLTFYVGNEVLALDLLHIKEIIPYEDITEIPLMQECILGVINLRGHIVPVVDINKRLELNVNMKLYKHRSIVIVSIVEDEKEIDIGIVVNVVSEVFSYVLDDLESSPLFGTKIKKRFVKQEAKIGTVFIPILDIENVLNVEELSVTNQDGIQ